MFCRNCGNEIADIAAVCVKCGVATGNVAGFGAANSGEISSRHRYIYVLLAVFLGGLGVHNFYAGYTGKAMTQLITCIVGIVASMVFIGFIVIFCLGVWVLIDAITVTADANGKKFQ